MKLRRSLKSNQSNLLDSDFVAPFLSGSQNTSIPIQESFPAVEIVTSNPTKRGGNFSVDEDNILVSAWLNISMDVVQGTDQRAKKIWEKIWQYFCENNTYGTTHSASSLQIEARNKSGGTKEDKLKDANELYKASPAPTTDKKTTFAFEHCWIVLKNQPKWIGSNDDDTMVLERPIGKKAEKAKRKRTDDDKGFEDYLAKKLQYIQELHEQYKESLRIKANRAQRGDIEKERLRLETIREAGRVMTMDTSGINEKERLYFENLKDEIRARQHLE
ncbi:hypothetical protein ACB092_02G019700 [Castanea dentata]